MVPQFSEGRDVNELGVSDLVHELLTPFRK
jgi:hypothetical protein